MKRLIIFCSIIAMTQSNKYKEYCDIKGSVKNPGVYEIKENYMIQDVIKLAGGLNKDAFTDNINLSKKVKDEMVIYIFNKEEIKQAKEKNNCVCKPIYKYIECEKEVNKTTTTKPIVTTTIPIENITTTMTTTTKTTNNQTTIKTTKKLETEKPTSTTTTKKPTTRTTTKTTTQIIEEIKKININNATIEELMSINGLGEKKATAIIEYRETVSRFNNIEELLNVKGIGETLFEHIKEYIEV